MANETRYYEVGEHLVEAVSGAAAWRHIAEKQVPKAKLCGVQDVVRLLQAGKKIEIAQKEPIA